MKHPSLLDAFSDFHNVAARQPNIGGIVGVGFCGGGGSSIGLKQAGLKVDFAMNHDAAAIAMHTANCPEAEHFCQDIWQVRPEDVRPGEPIRFMWFSPDCKHFSKAKGAAPVEKKIRDLAWVMLLWAKLRRPDVIAMENVEEFATWGPIGPNGQPIKSREGEYFRAFKREWRRLGYTLAFKKLRSADFGDPTTRLRLFGQFRCDGQPIEWPEATHAPRHHPDVLAGRKLPWVSAASILDFSQPVYSIFMTREEAREGRIDINRPLVDNTLARVTLGFQRWVLEADEPCIINITNGSAAPRARSVEDPLWTQTCSKGGEYAMVAPSLIPLTHQGAPRAHDARDPTRTMTGANRGEIAMSAAHLIKFRSHSDGGDLADPAPGMTANSFVKRPGGAAPVGLAAIHMAQHNAGPNNDGLSGRAAIDPVSTLATAGAQQNLVTSHIMHMRGAGYRPGYAVKRPLVALTAEGTHVAEVRTFLVKYYKSAEHGQAATDPLHALTTKARFGLVQVSTADVELTEEQRYNAWWVARLIDVFGHPDGRPERRRRPKKGFGSLRYRTLIGQIEEMHRERPSAVGRDGWIAWDIGMRMLTVAERFRAQGVPNDFITNVSVNGKPITETKKGEMCGNMVTAGVARALALAALPEFRRPEAMAA